MQRSAFPSYCIAFVLHLSALTACGSAVSSLVTVSEAAVYEVSGERLVVRSGPPGLGAVAWASFEDSLNATGWGSLNVHTSGRFSDDVQHQAAGMVEGFLTATHIYSAHLNVINMFFESAKVPEPVVKFFDVQLRWAWSQVKSNRKSTFWRHTSALLSQLDGLRVGYNLAANASTLPPLEASVFQLLSGAGDLGDILNAIDPGRRRKFEAMTVDDLRWFVKTHGMCSALVKVTGDFSDLLMGHSTWIGYSAMDRIFKHYNFQHQIPSAADRIGFSSYPGFLVSVDDFYMMSSGLGMVQTSNDVFNMSLYDMVKPESLLAWQRVRIASAMAHSGQEWSETFQTHASGTYVNQYMVVDFKLFSPGAALRNGTLWVTEEIPGLIVHADQTETLSRGYWPSYNVPYYREIYRRSGYADHDLGPDGSYQLAPRAKIFRRDQAQVTDIRTLKQIMRYANYSDPYAQKSDGSVDYSAAVCMRGDMGPHGDLSGCIDTKVTSYMHGFWNLTAEVVNGPTSTASDGTHGASGNAPFAWRTGDKHASHEGLPARFSFDFVTIRPKDLPCSSCGGAQNIVI